MATTITRLLHHLALFLLVVQFADAVLLPKTKNHAALKPQSSSTTYIVHANDLTKPPHFGSLEEWYHSMVTTHATSTRAASSSGILYTYDTVMHGFAVQLTADEARRMASATGVNAVHEDRQLHLLTTRTPGFLGLDPEFGAWRDTDLGDGVIVGFVDSGIWPESASFSDRGLGPVRSSWRGTCVGAGDFNASLCNRKLVGAKAFGRGDGGNSPRDKIGHGTHVASTAAGSEVPDVGVLMFARGKARGVAPKARIAMYKVSGMMTAVAAAIDAAVKDGVDIISLSLGDDNPPQFFDDSIAIAAFGAERSGVFVVLAGGNNGPNASTVTNVAPWMTTVGAATVDRLFPAYLNLGDGTVLTGQSLYARKSNTAMTPLLLSSCTGGVTAEKTKGKILVCMDADAARRRKSSGRRQVPNADGHDGPVGIVYVDTDGWSQDSGGFDLVVVDASTPPMLVLSLSAGEQLKDYIASTAYPVASLSFPCTTVIAENRAPMVATFSSRGPNSVAPQLLKPDLVAPGQDVLAAWRGGGYVMASGTSMSCPHVAGAAALIRKKHPDWTPAMMRSALVTTAATLDNAGRNILDNAVFRGRGATAATPFAAGAGHVRPQLAMDPGLVYDAGATDYVDFLCALGYTTEQVRVFVTDPGLATCTRPPLPGGPAGLNYPSFVVAFGGRGDVVTLTRRVTKVSEGAERYAVTVEAPEHVEVTITPAVLEFKERMETKTYTAEFRAEAGRDPREAAWDFGHIVWESEKHQVRSPVAFHFE